MYKFALLGDGVDYSRSPEIFRAIFSCANVEGAFETVNCSAENLPSEISRLRDEGYLALSVTIPHKEAVISQLDEIDSIAEAIRSVNSIRLDSQKKVGFNTDVFGFSQMLQQYGGVLKGKRAIVLGAGGAARSAAYALAIEFEVADIAFVGRNEMRLHRSVETLSKTLIKTQLQSHTFESLRTSGAAARELSEALLVVNATPLGGPNARPANDSIVFDLLRSTSMYYDLNYNLDNEFFLAAKESGATALHGLPMLTHQALRSFYLWSGIQVDYDSVAERIDG
jgi:shikimate dehydrogenase